MSKPAALCRDCLNMTAGPARCAECGSPRLLAHPERDSLGTAHIDCDAFYAAVEKRDNPSLNDKPLIIGGARRGVVLTCCYIARTFGVRSAMPMFKALALCPDAVVIRPDMAKYVRVGREIRRRMLALTPLVEPLSIDEAFLDLVGTERLHGMAPAECLARFARSIEREIGVSISIGLSYCKFLAKIASDLDKPRGFAIIGRSEARSFLADKPIGLIWGVGRVQAERLARDGLRTIADLQSLDEGEALRRIGNEGARLWRLAQGIDTRPVSPHREAKTISAETTFEVDLDTPVSLEPILFRLSEKVSGRLKAQGLAGKSLTLKLKTADFRIRTRARALAEPTQLATRIFAAARELLAHETDGTRFRLIGVGLSDLGPAADADHGDLIDTR
ncbi:MAG TPA: DNA polymerase IV, partial [Beijerinckiaceae bacterium]|nr:DNA polymerase IV [Beijerinckiaceae bacterium]